MTPRLYLTLKLTLSLFYSYDSIVAIRYKRHTQKSINKNIMYINLSLFY